MADDHASTPSPQLGCRWRTSAETVDVVEALERIESILLGLDGRMRAIEAAAGIASRDVLAPAGSRASEDTR